MPTLPEEDATFCRCRDNTRSAIEEIRKLVRGKTPEFPTVYEMLKATAEYIECEARKAPYLVKVR